MEIYKINIKTSKGVYTLDGCFSKTNSYGFIKSGKQHICQFRDIAEKPEKSYIDYKTEVSDDVKNEIIIFIEEAWNEAIGFLNTKS